MIVVASATAPRRPRRRNARLRRGSERKSLGPPSLHLSMAAFSSALMSARTFSTKTGLEPMRAERCSRRSKSFIRHRSVRASPTTYAPLEAPHADPEQSRSPREERPPPMTPQRDHNARHRPRRNCGRRYRERGRLTCGDGGESTRRNGGCKASRSVQYGKSSNARGDRRSG